MAATTTQRAQRALKSTAKRSTAKPKTAKPKSTKRQAKPKTAKVAKRSTAKTPKSTPQPRAERLPRDIASAEKATALMRKNTRGDKRSPVSANQVATVRAVVGRRSVATIAKQLGFPSAAAIKRHAGGELDKMPDGASAKLAEFGTQLSGAGASKIRGRKLTAILASL